MGMENGQFDEWKTRRKNGNSTDSGLHTINLGSQKKAIVACLNSDYPTGRKVVAEMESFISKSHVLSYNEEIEFP